MLSPLLLLSLGLVLLPSGAAVLVPATSRSAAAKPKPARPPQLHVRIGDAWYDLTRWRSAHPAGTHWIDGYSDRDATEVFHAFHSDDANAMLTRLPRTVAELRVKPPPALQPSDLMISFRELRDRLTVEGWFERVWWREAMVLAPCLSLFAFGTAVARVLPLVATVCLALGSVAAGWIGHDFVHGRGKWCGMMRGFGALFNGHSATWWSNKHNLHHACTNVVGVDEDIMADPFFYLWAPDPSRDSKWRHLQHLYMIPVYASLFALWRFNSLRTLHSMRKHWSNESLLIALNYAWIALFLPLSVAIGHVFLSGVITATVVTASHQSEEMLDEQPHDWVRAQLVTTRDAVTCSPFTEWLWGGMQYQIEHHLFPTMPRYKYPALVPHIRQLCADNQIEYRSEGEIAILKRNWQTLRAVAQAPASPGAAGSRSDTVWSRRSGAAWVGSDAHGDAAAEAGEGH